MPDDSQQVHLDEEVELPPAIEALIESIKEDQKRVRKDKAFSNGDNLRQFIGLSLIPRLIDSVKLLASAWYDTYSLAVQNANQIQRLRAYLNRELKGLGVEVDEGELPGIGPEVLDDLQKAFFALGSLLQERLPNDKEAQKAFNNCAEILGEMVRELMGEEEEEEEEGEPDEAGAEAEEKEEPAKKDDEAGEEAKET